SPRHQRFHAAPLRLSLRSLDISCIVEPRPWVIEKRSHVARAEWLRTGLTSHERVQRRFAQIRGELQVGSCPINGGGHRVLQHGALSGLSTCPCSSTCSFSHEWLLSLHGSAAEWIRTYPREAAPGGAVGARAAGAADRSGQRCSRCRMTCRAGAPKLLSSPM